MSSVRQQREQVEEVGDTSSGQGEPVRAPGAAGGPDESVRPPDVETAFESLTSSDDSMVLSSSLSWADGDYSATVDWSPAISPSSALLEDTWDCEPSHTYSNRWSDLAAPEEVDNGGTRENLFDK